MDCIVAHGGVRGITFEEACELAARCACASTLHTLDLSGCGMTSEGAARVLRATAPLATLTVCDLSGNALGNHGATCIGRLLTSAQTVRVLALRDCALGHDGAGAIARALRLNTSVTALDVGVNQRIGDGGVLTLLRMLACNTSLLDLCLASCGFKLPSTASALRGVCTAPRAMLPRALLTCLRAQTDLSCAGCNVRAIQLAGNCIGGVDCMTALVSAVPGAPSLRSLKLSSMRMLSAGAAALALGLGAPAWSHVAELDVSWNDIGDLGASTLLSALESNGSVVRAVMDGCGVGDRACTALARVLETNRTLRVLRASHNKISLAGMTRVAESLRHNDALTSIDCRCCGPDIQGCLLPVAASMSLNSAMRQFSISAFPCATCAASGNECRGQLAALLQQRFRAPLVRLVLRTRALVLEGRATWCVL